jgi:hypothetical protein
MINKWLAAFFASIPVLSAWLYVAVSHWLPTWDSPQFHRGFLEALAMLTIITFYIVLIILWFTTLDDPEKLDTDQE